MMGNNYSYSRRKFKNYIAPKFIASQEAQSINNSIVKLVEQKQQKQQQKSIKIYLDKFQPIVGPFVPPFRVYGLQKNNEGESKLKLKILTYNIWFQNNNIENRIPCLLKIMEQSDADIICLQQVTKGFLQHLDKSSVIKQRYPVILRNLMNWYDTIILSKYHCRPVRKSFETTFMGRGMLLVQIIIEGGKNIIVGSMHYESLDSTQARLEQMRETFQACKECPNVIIAGDFNFSDGAIQNELIEKHEYKDLWLEDLKRKKQEHSMKDSQTMPKTPKFSAWRPDHIIYKLTQSDEEDHKIMKVGQFTIHPFDNDPVNAIAKDGIVRTPSDHFGLFAQISI